MQFSIFGYDFTLSELIALGCGLFLTVFYAVKTHGLKNIIKEVLKMNYIFKTLQSVEESEGQTFATEKPVYRLNKATGKLEMTDEKVDLQALIESSLDNALNKVLDRLIPKVEQAEDLAELDVMRDDLDIAMEVSNRAEEYRERFKLPDSYSINDIYNHVAKQADILKAKIDTVKSMQFKNKEGFEDEKKDVEKSE